MLKLLPVTYDVPFLIEICDLLMNYGGLIFSEIDDPVISFLNTLVDDKSKVIAALNDEKLIAFAVLYNFKMISNDTFSCYIYGASKRKCARELDILFPVLFNSLKNQGCKVIRCETRIYNMAMRVLAQRLNFRKVGLLKASSFYNGKFIDNILYEKLL